MLLNMVGLAVYTSQWSEFTMTDNHMLRMK